ncbi:hypothetical protein M3Y97_01159300 [Aphelenchoides bicaudatus]|nr:hypothetical protein M3Y97_01159300 [Aphelenchoides bicaudatus]
MTDINDLRALIRQEIQLGRPLHEVFTNVVRRIPGNDYNYPPTTVCNWFGSLKSGEDNLRRQFTELPPSCYEILVLIRDEFELTLNGRFLQTCPARKCKIQLLNDRYAIDGRVGAEWVLESLVLFDLWHGKWRELKLNDSLPGKLMCYQYDLVVINPNYFMFIDKRSGDQEWEPKMKINLFRLDYSQFEATLLDTKALDGQFVRVIFDSVDQNKFLICGSIEVASRDAWIQRANNKLYVLSIKRSENDTNQLKASISLSEVAFNTAQEQLHQIFPISNENSINETDLIHLTYTWSGNTCYAIKHSGAVDAPLYKIDLDTRRLSILSINNVDKSNCLLVDEDGVLNVMCQNEYTKQHALVKIPLSRPVRLVNLAMSGVHRILMSKYEDTYNSIIANLNPELRPFSEIV